jgi:hypothetical protein
VYAAGGRQRYGCRELFTKWQLVISKKGALLVPYNPEKGPNDPTRRPETRPGLAKPTPTKDMARKLGEQAVKGAKNDKK